MLRMAYTLSVFHKGERTPTETVFANRAPDAFRQIQELLSRHRDCERIRVYSYSAFLFAVDCHGERVDE